MRFNRLLKTAFIALALLTLLGAVHQCAGVYRRFILLKRQEAQNTVNIYGEKIRLQMLESLDPTVELATTAVYSDIDDTFWFNELAGPLIERKDVRLVSLAKGDIITKTLPQTRQKAFIGRDIKNLSYVYTLAKVVQNLVIDGPVMMDLHPNDPSVFLYIRPIYRNDIYIGEIIVALDSDVVIEELNLEYFALNGYDYELWHSNQQDGQKRVIAVSDPLVDFSDSVKTDIFLSGEWKLSIQPVNGWLSEWQKRTIFAAGAMISVLYISFFVLLYHLIIRMHKLRVFDLHDANSRLVNKRGFIKKLDSLFRAKTPVAIIYFVYEGYNYYAQHMTFEETEQIVRDLPNRIKRAIHSPFTLGRVGEAGFITAVCDQLTQEQLEDMAKSVSIELILKTDIDGKHRFLSPHYLCLLPENGESAIAVVSRTMKLYCQKNYSDSDVSKLIKICRLLTEGQNDVEFEECADPELMELTKIFNQYRKQVEQIAYNDPVLHVGNRLKFLRDANLLISYNTQRPFSVFCVDICKFSQYNQLFNAGVGDAILAEISERLPRLFGDYLYRINGDVFLGIVISANSSESFAIKLRQILSEPFEIDNSSLEINTRIIVCSYPANGQTPEELIDRTEAAIRYSKTTGEETVICNEQLNSVLREESSIILALNDAIHEDNLEVWYQPIHSLENGCFNAAEALVRLSDDENGGYYSAGRVVALAERSGFVESMGDYVLEKACMFMKEHGDRLGLSHISVNVSAQQLAGRNSSAHILDIIGKCGLAPEKVMLEITESTLMQSLRTTVAVLKKLRRVGIKIALDDFGTGYSSLYYLSNLPVDALKIDRGLTRQFMQSEKQRMLVSAIFKIAEINSLSFVAEGVETAEELERLRDIGIDRVQGYYFARPMPKEKLMEFLAEENCKKNAITDKKN